MGTYFKYIHFLFHAFFLVVISGSPGGLGQEATVRTGHGTTDWFQIGKGIRQGCILSPCLFNLYSEYIMRNAGLEETQAGIKNAKRNINNLRYADDILYIELPKDTVRKLLELINEFSKVA